MPYYNVMNNRSTVQLDLRNSQGKYLELFEPASFHVIARIFPITAVVSSNRELKKLRRPLKGKRLIKTELCVKLSLLRQFHVDHVVQNRRSALSLACHEWFSCKGKEGKIYCCELPLSSKPQI